MRIVLLAGDARESALAEAFLAAGHTVVHASDRIDGSAQDAALLVRRPTDGLADLLPGFDRIVATSAATAEWLQTTCGVAAERIATIVPGVAPAPRNPGRTLGCGLLAFDGEGVELLFAALARLFDLDWLLTVVGAGRHAELTTTLAIEQRVRAGVAAEWDDVDLLVWPAPWRGETPAPIGEALRRGVPVIATIDGTEAAAVPQKAGLVCPPGDRDQLSRALRRLIFDPSLRRAYADAAFEAGCALPDWPAQARRIAAVLR